MLQDLQNALQQIDELKAKNWELEEKLLLAAAGKRDTTRNGKFRKKCEIYLTK